MTSHRAVNDNLSPEERLFLRILEPGRAILRPGRNGDPFHIAGARIGTARDRVRFPEALIYGLVQKGLVTITQAVQAEPRVGLRYKPFAAVLSREGENARAYELARRRGWPDQAANDLIERYRRGLAA